MKISQVYTKLPVPPSADSVCTTMFENVWTIMTKEVRIWWDLTGCKQYMREAMMPRIPRFSQNPSE